MLANRLRRTGFTLVELLVVVAIIAVLSSFILPALSKAQERVLAIACLNNTHQLELACQLYTEEHENSLPYNLVMKEFSFRTNINWVNNVMTWDKNSDNTNIATITGASLGPFIGGSVRIFKCPSDDVLSPVQRNLGWRERIRSYSLNAMVGNAGTVTESGANTNNPSYKQFFKTTQIRQPSEIFTFIDEHPDSIGDGYFLNKASYGYGAAWTDLPASYHNGAASFAFADGHSSLHRWVDAGTVRPPDPDSLELPQEVSSRAHSDYDWVIQHMSIEK